MVCFFLWFGKIQYTKIFIRKSFLNFIAFFKCRKSNLENTLEQNKEKSSSQITFILDVLWLSWAFGDHNSWPLGF